MFGLDEEPGTGRLTRRVPRSVRGEFGVARELAALTGKEEDRCSRAIEKTLLTGFLDAKHPQTGFPAFAFRLHQFISRGDTVFASLEPEAQRHVTLQAQQFVPGDRERILLPLAFCRECGQEYYVVRLREDGTIAGFLHLSATDPWPEDAEAILDLVPEDWLEPSGAGRRVKLSYRRLLPEPLTISRRRKRKSNSSRTPENVATRRRDRISSDEEERLRLGYELRTAVRFADAAGRPSHEVATVTLDDNQLATLTYGHAATLWRINFGWTRRTNPAVQGFPLDVQHGYWKSEGELEDDENGDDPGGALLRRVVPFVEDRRNALLFKWHDTLADGQMASLQAALKHAVQARFQLEESELAAEPLPNPDARHYILLYESAEGGAGVLRRLVEDPRALGAVAREALEICHFDPDTGADRRRAPRAREDCEAACYDCLMSYSNQRDHQLLDRAAVRDVLQQLARATVDGSPGPIAREALLQQLLHAAGSALERRWLESLQAFHLALPSSAQVLVEACRTRPDFLYAAQRAAIYVDGPHHDDPAQRAIDRQQEDALIDADYTVVRFPHDRPWDSIFDRYLSVFGVRS